MKNIFKLRTVSTRSRCFQSETSVLGDFQYVGEEDPKQLLYLEVSSALMSGSD